MSHRIHSVYADGPVGKTGKIFAGDYLIEVNGVYILEMTHLDVVKLIQSLPRHIRLIVARQKPGLGKLQVSYYKMQKKKVKERKS